MFFLALTLVLMASESTAPFDSVLQSACVEHQVDYDTASAVFATLDSALVAIEQHNWRPRNNSMNGGCITPDSLERLLNCQLPQSILTDSSFLVCTGFYPIEYDTGTCKSFIVSFYDPSSEGHLPLARLTYCRTTKLRTYEFVENAHQQVSITVQ